MSYDITRLCENVAALTAKLEAYIDNHQASQIRLEGDHADLQDRVKVLEDYKSWATGVLAAVATVASVVGAGLTLLIDKVFK